MLFLLECLRERTKIEPSGLISRIVTFVLAGCLTIVVVLIVALTQMFPLERTQVFFLESKPMADQSISISSLNMSPGNLEVYKENFIKEYVVARNQIVPSNAIMRKKWRADGNGQVYAYSSVDVYKEFMKTDMWHAVMAGKFEPLTFRCDVSFDNFAPRSANKYAVTFRYICTDDSAGQSESKDFTIAIGLQLQGKVNWNERLENPLGVKVVSYEIEDGMSDPLDVLQY